LKSVVELSETWIEQKTEEIRDLGECEESEA
jgi:hypothetical protein